MRTRIEPTFFYLLKGKKHVTDKIKEFEATLLAEENKISNLLRCGKILTPLDYAEVDRIKKELKVARRVMAMDASRTEPKLTRKISVLLSENEFENLSRKAQNECIILSKYIRRLLKLGLKVEDNAPL
jgi:hypothetical protein